MRHEIIEKIRKINGVKSAEFNDNDIITVLLAKREPLFITEDGVEIFKNENYWFVYKDYEEWKFCINAVPSVIFLSDKAKRFSTDQAAKDWIAAQKPKFLKPEELVDGEIYSVIEGKYIHIIFRFKSLYANTLPSCNHYSLLTTNKEFRANQWLVFSTEFRTCNHATLAEKQTLIHAEIENGFYYELKNQK